MRLTTPYTPPSGIGFEPLRLRFSAPLGLGSWHLRTIADALTMWKVRGEQQLFELSEVSEFATSWIWRQNSKTISIEFVEHVHHQKTGESMRGATWTDHDNRVVFALISEPMTRNQGDAPEVLAHELGHILGLTHEDGSPLDVMGTSSRRRQPNAGVTAHLKKLACERRAAGYLGELRP